MKVFLVGLDTGEDKEFDQSMKELANLSEACDMEVVGTIVQHFGEVNKAFYIGSGKVVEVKEKAAEVDAECVIFDNALSPSQLRNLQDELELAVMDRTTLILEIFATRAGTREAMLQVETARLQYILPRLVGLGKALSRQGGSSGSRSSKGAGEKKLELDRRRLEHRLNECRRQLSELGETRKIQRKQRAQSAIPRVALVGYTNAGKSTLLNAMLDLFSGSDADAEEKKVMVKDMLFATLDTTVRRLQPSNHCPILLSDTVGFIHKLPHDLVEAFKSTLEETKEADLLLEVVDGADPNHMDQIQVTDETLATLGAGAVKKIYVYNKADLYYDESELPVIKDDRIYISAEKKIGLEELYTLIEQKLAGNFRNCRMLVPYDKGDVIAHFDYCKAVRKREFVENGVQIDLFCSEADYEKYKQYEV